jgi:choline-sulfatase
VERRPDLVLVMTDQQRFDWMGYVDGQFETPHLDALAAGGITFDAGYSASTVCVPSRTSLLTGLHHHRVLEGDGPPRSLRQGFWTVARELRAAGYETALIGRMHLNPVRGEHGFETMRMCENSSPGSGYSEHHVDDYGAWLASEGRPDWRLVTPGPDGSLVPYLPAQPRVFPDDAGHHSTAWIEREAVEFLRHRRGDRPLLLIVSFPHPHGPYDPPEPYASRVDPSTTVVPGESFAMNEAFPEAFQGDLEEPWARRADIRPRLLRSVLTAVRALVHQIDDSVGRIVAELDLASTLLWFTSDHGDYGGHRGLLAKSPWFPLEDLLRVPLFVTGGAAAGAARRSGTPVQTGSFVPTCLDYAGADVDPDLFDFPSLRPLLDANDDSALSGTALDPDRPFFASVSAGYPMVRRGRHKAIYRAFTGEVMAFDLEADPRETSPLPPGAEGDRVRAELRAVAAEQLRWGPADPFFVRELTSA